MLSKQPFERRILIAFVLMTVMVSGLFSLSIVAVVHFIEEHLVSQDMSRQLDETLKEDISQGLPPRLDSSTCSAARKIAGSCAINERIRILQRWQMNYQLRPDLKASRQNTAHRRNPD